MCYHHYQPGHRRTLPKEHLSLVRPPKEGYHGQGPLIYLALWESARDPHRGLTEHLYSLPPPNGQAFQVKELIGGAILTYSHLGLPGRLDELALYRFSCSQ
jgi:hypothetical protein